MFIIQKWVGRKADQFITVGQKVCQKSYPRKFETNFWMLMLLEEGWRMVVVSCMMEYHNLAFHNWVSHILEYHNLACRMVVVSCMMEYHNLACRRWGLHMFRLALGNNKYLVLDKSIRFQALGKHILGFDRFHQELDKYKHLQEKDKYRLYCQVYSRYPPD